MSRSSIPARTASSTTYWIAGLSTIGSISLASDLVAGRNRVPSPAAGMTAFFTFMAAPRPCAPSDGDRECIRSTACENIPLGWPCGEDRPPRVHVPLVRERAVDRAGHRGVPRTRGPGGRPGPGRGPNGGGRPAAVGGAGADALWRDGAGRARRGGGRGDRPGGRAGAGVRPRRPPPGLRGRLLRRVPAAAAARVCGGGHLLRRAARRP